MTASDDFFSEDRTFGEQLSWHMMRGTRPPNVANLGKSWSNKELADAALVTDRQVRNWRSGKSAPIATDTLERIFFGYKPEEHSFFRMEFRKAHCKMRYGIELNMIDQSSSENWDEYELSKFRDSIDVTIKSLEYIKLSAIHLGTEIQSKNPALESVHTPWSMSGKHRNLLIEFSSIPHWITNESGEQRETYATLCRNLDHMVIIRKTIINLMDRGLHQPSISRQELNEICRALYDTIDSIKRLIIEFYSINLALTDSSEKRPPRILMSFMADTVCACNTIVDMLKFNRKSGNNETNIFQNESYREYLLKLRNQMAEIVTFLCDMELPKPDSD